MSERALVAVPNHSPVSTSLSGDHTRAVIKGFASLETLDRSGHLVDPYEFNIEKFMTNPTLLYNHRYYVDGGGNKHAIGRVTKMLVGKLVKGDDENYNVVRDGTREVVGTISKAKLVDVPTGTRGLWVEAEITEPEIAQKVHNGELSTLSWRGFTRMSFGLNNDSTVRKDLKDIRLMEISVVNIPDNQDAVFVMKNGDSGTEFSRLDGPLLVHSVRFNKDRFDDERAMSNCLDRFGLSNDKIVKDGNYCYAVQKSSLTEDVDLVSVQLVDEIELIVGKMEDVDGAIAIPLDKETRSFLDKGDEMAETSEKAIETPSDANTTASVDKSANETVAKAGDLQGFLADLSKTLTETFAGTKTAIDGLVETNKSLCQSIEKHFKKDEIEVETKKAEASPQDVIKSLQAEIASLKTNLHEISKSVPMQTVREETVEVQKSKDNEKVSFNGLFPPQLRVKS